jgi:hypothetical protein
LQVRVLPGEPNTRLQSGFPHTAKNTSSVDGLSATRVLLGAKSNAARRSAFRWVLLSVH